MTEKEIVDVQEKTQSITTCNIKYLTFSAIIETVLAVFLLIYLWIFSAATYSAFFKNFETSSGILISSFLAPTAISDAWKTGITTGLFVTIFPFIFVTLGFLVFKTSKTRKNKYLDVLKTIGILLWAFLYDALIAYSISAKVHELNIGLANKAVFNWNICLKDPNFWLIILAGFIVFVIFGFVYNSASKKWEIILSNTKKAKK